MSDGMSGIAADAWAAGPLAEGTGGGKKGPEGPQAPIEAVPVLAEGMADGMGAPKRRPTSQTELM